MLRARETRESPGRQWGHEAVSCCVCRMKSAVSETRLIFPPLPFLTASSSLLHVRSLRMMPGRGNKNKYPQIKPSYESRGTRGLFVLGTASHSIDFRKSAGGFIHGFRYTSECWGVQKGRGWGPPLPWKEQFRACCWKGMTPRPRLAAGITKRSQAAAAQGRRGRGSDSGSYQKPVVVCLCFVLYLCCLLSLSCVTIDFCLPDTRPGDRLWVRGLRCGAKTRQL